MQSSISISSNISHCLIELSRVLYMYPHNLIVEIYDRVEPTGHIIKPMLLYCHRSSRLHHLHICYCFSSLSTVFTKSCHYTTNSISGLHIRFDDRCRYKSITLSNHLILRMLFFSITTFICSTKISTKNRHEFIKLIAHSSESSHNGL